MTLIRRLTASLALLAPCRALAHEGRPLAPHDAWRAWELEPVVVLTLVVTAALYAMGIAALRRRARGARRPMHRAALLFAAGWVVLTLALVSPLHAMGSVLFSAHMAQHELLMALAPPLLVLAHPGVAWLWAFPPEWRRRIGRWTRRPRVRATWAWLSSASVATIIHAAALWLWHAPSFYERSVTSEAAHAAQHTSFILSAMLFWWAVLGHGHSRRRAGAGIFALFLTMMHTGALGALIAMAGTPWYPSYATTTQAWGLTPLEDQQLAGLVMWIPASLSYLVAALWLFLRFMGASDDARGTARRRAARAAPLLLLLLLVTGCDRGEGLSEAQAATLTRGGSPARGAAAIRAYGCGTCHTVRGVVGANSLVGPPLQGLRQRLYVAGVVTNTPDNLMRWIRDPQAIDPHTAMPSLGVTARDARDIAAYLYSLP